MECEVEEPIEVVPQNIEPPKPKNISVNVPNFGGKMTVGGHSKGPVKVDGAKYVPQIEVGNLNEARDVIKELEEKVNALEL